MIEDISEEELNKLREDTTIDGVIKLKNIEESAIDEYFNYIWTTYHQMQNGRKDILKNLKQAKLRISLLNFIMKITNDEDIHKELEILLNCIKNNIDIIKSEKELINLVYIAIEKLQRYRIVDANEEIYNILDLLNEKNIILFDSVSDAIGNLATRINGISITTKDVSKQIEDTDTQINTSVLNLGLKKS